MQKKRKNGLKAMPKYVGGNEREVGMSEKKLAYFLITGELLLDILKQKTDLPEDTKLVLVDTKKGQPLKNKAIKKLINKKYSEGNKNVIRFIVESDKEFFIVGDDYYIPSIIPMAKQK